MVIKEILYYINNYINSYTNYFNIICNYIKVRNTKTLPFIYKCEFTKEKILYISWYKNLYMIINVILIILTSYLLYKLNEKKKIVNQSSKIQEILNDLDKLNNVDTLDVKPEVSKKRKLEMIIETNKQNLEYRNRIYTNEFNLPQKKIVEKSDNLRLEEFDIINL